MGAPSPTTPTLPNSLSAVATFSTFGTATDIEPGFITFATFPGGVFAPASVTSTFTFSFNGGADTFSGTDTVTFGAPDLSGTQTESNVRIVLSGTGKFLGATGTLISTGLDFAPGATTPPTNTFSGNGQISAPGLSAVPEPASFLLLGGSLFFFGIAKRTALRVKE